LNSLHIHSSPFSSQERIAPGTADDVLGAFTGGGDWVSALNRLANDQDVQAVEGLENVLHCAEGNAIQSLKDAVMALLKSFKPQSNGWQEAQLIIAPTAGGILKAFDSVGSRENNPAWARTMDRLASRGDGDAIEVLGELLKEGQPKQLASKAGACLREMRDRQSTEHNVAEKIDTALGEVTPRRYSGLPTKNDGDCLIHAVLGASQGGMFQCTPEDVLQWREALKTRLLKCSDSNEPLPPSVEGSLAVFFADLKAASWDMDVQNQAAMKMDATNLKHHIHDIDEPASITPEGKVALLRLFAERVAEKGFYLPPDMAPLLAEVSARPVKLYVDGAGWKCFDAKGLPSSAEAQAVAIRFSSTAQHFERVEPSIDAFSRLPSSSDGDEVAADVDEGGGANPLPASNQTVFMVRLNQMLPAAIPGRLKFESMDSLVSTSRVDTLPRPVPLDAEQQRKPTTAQTRMEQRGFWGRLLGMFSGWMAGWFGLSS